LIRDKALEIIYQNKPRTLLDSFFLSSRPARGARNRLQVLQEEICKCVKQRSKVSNPVWLISFGSGPGHEILGAIERLIGTVVKATCVDKEPSAPNPLSKPCCVAGSFNRNLVLLTQGLEKLLNLSDVECCNPLFALTA